MSTPIVVTACMVQSSESGRPRRPWHLRAGGGAVHSIIFGPSASQQNSKLFDHLVGAGQQRGWDGKAERLCSSKIEHQFKCGWLLERQVRRPCSLDNCAEEGGSRPKFPPKIHAVLN